MRQRRIMEETGRIGGAIERVQQQIDFCRVEIAGGRIVTHRPGRTLDALPGAEPEGKLQKQAQRAAIERRWFRRGAGKCGGWRAR